MSKSTSGFDRNTLKKKLDRSKKGKAGEVLNPRKPLKQYILRKYSGPWGPSVAKSDFVEISTFHKYKSKAAKSDCLREI